MSDWLAAARAALADGREAVRVSVAMVRGSAPREAGAAMLVTLGAQHGTIGGGHLEFLATRIARELLAREGTARVDRFSLGATLGQCCGGAVALWFERLGIEDRAWIDEATEAAARDGTAVLATTLAGDRITDRRVHGPGGTAWSSVPEAVRTGDARACLAAVDCGQETLYERIDADSLPLWVFGAGHVARALVPMVAPLPFTITWLDSRDAAFPDSLPPGVEARTSADPPAEAMNAPAQAIFLVMTHSHDEDFEICRALLQRPHLAWAGLIGSASKRTRFRQRLEARGVDRTDFERITCPIGLPGIAGKRPAEIAIATAAQLLQVAQALRAGQRSISATKSA